MRKRVGVVLVVAFVVAAAGGSGCARRDDAETASRANAGAGPRAATVGEQRSALRTGAQDGAGLVRLLGCGGCHVGVPAPTVPIAMSLAADDRARDPATTFAYLRDSPTRESSPERRAAARTVPGEALDRSRAAPAGEAHVPSFHLDDAEALALSLYLAAGPVSGGDAARRFDAARRSHGDVDAALGARIFRALNCAACHEHDGAERRRNGPPLVSVASRLRPEALRDFLLDPRAVRPFGFEPGSGGRMPDFALSGAEADSIAAYLTTFGVQFAALESPDARPLSAFGAAKARALLEQKLSCLGCHALGGEGGRIGPDLARAAERVTPEYLAATISDPEHVMPGTVMPRAALPRSTRDLVIAFLAAGGAAAVANRETGEAMDPTEDTDEPERNGYLSLVDHPLTDAGTVEDGTPEASRGGGTDPAASRYATRCAACHGAEGRGDGYNARYLRARPAVHASADAMGRRADDTLFDGIHAGGAILGGSPEMPAFGESLSASEISGLVDYIRKLCDCRQPAWAEDGQ